MKRIILLVIGIALLSILLVAPRRAQATAGVCFALRADGPALCPTDQAHRVSVPRPINLPTLEIEPIEFENWTEEEKSNSPDVYAWIDDYSPIYRHPAEATEHLPPATVSEPGFTYYSLVGEVWYQDEHWYQINAGSEHYPPREDQYVHADHVHLVRPSVFAGVNLATQPSLPFAWLLRMVRPSSLPGAPSDPDLAMRYRYQQVNIYGVERVGRYDWYLIGANQWVKQTYLGIVQVSPRPAGVGPGERWIEIDLYEQTLAAYEGDQMVYATLVSSGLPKWETRRGLFRIHYKLLKGHMSGAEGKPDYYYLEDVPWTMYFDGEIALHAAYWHDGFGYRHSHGCVNLPPISSHWLYEWTTPLMPEGLTRIAGQGTWVWVH